MSEPTPGDMKEIVRRLPNMAKTLALILTRETGPMLEQLDVTGYPSAAMTVEIEGRQVARVRLSVEELDEEAADAR